MHDPIEFEHKLRHIQRWVAEVRGLYGRYVAHVAALYALEYGRDPVALWWYCVRHRPAHLGQPQHRDLCIRAARRLEYVMETLGHTQDTYDAHVAGQHVDVIDVDVAGCIPGSCPPNGHDGAPATAAASAPDGPGSAGVSAVSAVSVPDDVVSRVAEALRTCSAWRTWAAEALGGADPDRVAVRVVHDLVRAALTRLVAWCRRHAILRAATTETAEADTGMPTVSGLDAIADMSGLGQALASLGFAGSSGPSVIVRGLVAHVSHAPPQPPQPPPQSQDVSPPATHISHTPHTPHAPLAGVPASQASQTPQTPQAPAHALSRVSYARAVRLTPDQVRPIYDAYPAHRRGPFEAFVRTLECGAWAVLAARGDPDPGATLLRITRTYANSWAATDRDGRAAVRAQRFFAAGGDWTCDPGDWEDPAERIARQRDAELNERVYRELARPRERRKSAYELEMERQARERREYERRLRVVEEGWIRTWAQRQQERAQSAQSAQSPQASPTSGDRAAWLRSLTPDERIELRRHEIAETERRRRQELYRLVYGDTPPAPAAQSSAQLSASLRTIASRVWQKVRSWLRSLVRRETETKTPPPPPPPPPQAPPPPQTPPAHASARLSPNEILMLLRARARREMQLSLVRDASVSLKQVLHQKTHEIQETRPDHD